MTGLRKGRLPATIIGGYLGAGKTTLVNHLLRHADGLRLAVLVNEFGALPIDADLIEAQDDNVISIAGGCICCSYGSDLMAALMDLAQLERRPDHVLIETSGVALPGSVAQSIGLLVDYVVDAVAVLADAETIEVQAADRFMADTIHRQLAQADMVVLNKCDLAKPGDLERLRTWLGRTCPGASIVETSHGKLSPDVLIGAGLPSAGQVNKRTGMGHVGHVTHDSATGGYSTFVVRVPTAADPSEVGQILAEPSLGLIRAKGTMAGPGGTAWVVQVVGRRWEARPADHASAHVGQIVCIAPAGCPGEAIVQRALLRAPSVAATP